MTHIDEDAEVYVLGALTEFESRRVETHIQACEMCAQRVQEAAQTVVRMSEHDELLEPPPQLSQRIAQTAKGKRASRLPKWVPAAAAAFLIGLALPTAYFTSMNRAQSRADQAALSSLVQSHFAHAQFADTPPGSPAKVLFARDGSWLYVVVHNAQADLLVRGRTADGHSSDLGSIPGHRENATLYVTVHERINRLELVDHDRVRGTARLPSLLSR